MFFVAKDKVMDIRCFSLWSSVAFLCGPQCKKNEYHTVTQRYHRVTQRDKLLKVFMFFVVKDKVMDMFFSVALCGFSLWSSV